MSEQEFEVYLKLLARCLGLTAGQREQIADELRDHLEERLAELEKMGLPREKAIVQALDEFGDAAVLAANFTTIAHLKRRRFLMRLSLGSAAVLAAGMLIAFAFWPENRVVQGPDKVVAVEKPKRANDPGAKPAPAHAASKPGAPRRAAPAAAARHLLSSHVDKTRARIEEALDMHVDFNIDSQPLGDALTFISDRYRIPIILDTRALEEDGVAQKSDVKLNLPGVTLRQTLTLLLAQLPGPLEFEICDGFLSVSTAEKIEAHMVVVVYDCRDLVHVRSLDVSEDASNFGKNSDAGADSDFDVQRKLPETTASAAGNAKHPSSEKMKTGRSVVARQFPVATDRRSGLPLIRVLEAATAPAGWGRAEDGTISEFGGLLIVRHNPAVQEQIKNLLADIRRVRKEGAFSSFEKGSVKEAPFSAPPEPKHATTREPAVEPEKKVPNGAF